MPVNVGPEALAEALNLSKRRIYQLVQFEGMPRSSPGKYDIWECTRWYIRYLQKAIERSSVAEDGNPIFMEEKKRLIRIRADIAELQYEQRRTELVPASLVDAAFESFVSTITKRVLALPSRISRRVEGKTAEIIRTELYKACRITLNQLAAELGRPGVKSQNRKAREKKKAEKRAIVPLARAR